MMIYKVHNNVSVARCVSHVYSVTCLIIDESNGIKSEKQRREAKWNCWQLNAYTSNRWYIPPVVSLP